MMQTIRCRAAGVTDPGLVRSANEDAMLLRDDAGLWVVADGMGGHKDGEVASGMIVSEMAVAPMTGAFDVDLETLADVLHRANAAIYDMGQQTGGRAGSTVVVLLVQGARLGCLWAGDSRIYLLRERLLVQLTRDHTQVQEMADRGLLQPHDVKGHPMGHLITRAVGVEPELLVDAVVDDLQPGDVILLCSDGLHGVADETEIAAILAGRNADAASAALVELARQRGAPDNVTAVCVVCEEVTALRLAGA